jgi:hypothetical protein
VFRKLAIILLLLGLPFVFFWRGATMQILLGDGDAFVHTLPVWTYAAEQLRNLRLPFWAHEIFGGYPLFAEPQSCAFHPSKLLFFLFQPLAAINLTILLCYGIAGIFTYLLAREEELTLESSVLAGISFAFCGYLIGHQAQTGLLVAATAFPVLFYTIRRTFRKLDYWSIAANAAAILYLVLSGHPQLVFYALMFSALYAGYLCLFEQESGRRLQFLKCLAGSYVLGAAWSAFQWVPTLEFSRLTTRESLSYEVFSQPSPHFSDLLASLISTRLHGFLNQNGSEAMLHIGLIVLLMAGVGVCVRRKQAAFWIFLLAFGSLLFVGTHTPLYRLMFWVPGYNLFRIPPRTGIAVDFALAILAAHGLSAIQNGFFRTYLSGWKRWAGIAAVPAVYYVGIHWAEYQVFEKLYWTRVKHGALSDWPDEAWRALLRSAGPYVGVMAVALAALFFLIRWTGRGRLAAVMVAGVAFFYFWSYRDWLFVAKAPDVELSLLTTPPLPRESAPFRMALGSHGNWTGYISRDPKGWHQKYALVGGPDFGLLTGVSSIGGYSPLVLRDYTRLAGAMGTGGEITEESLFSSPVLNLLNVRYVVVPLVGPALPKETFARLQLVNSTSKLRIYRNPRACGMFWGVKRVALFSSQDFWSELQSPKNDFSETAFLRRDDLSGLDGKSYATPQRIQIRYPDGNHIDVEVESKAPAFLASSHLYYPGWSAKLDGRSIEVVRANGLFMGVAVPAGKHRLVFQFSPWSFWIGLLGGLCFVAVFLGAAKTDLLRLRGARPAAPIGAGPAEEEIHE